MFVFVCPCVCVFHVMCMWMSFALSCVMLYSVCVCLRVACCFVFVRVCFVVVVFTAVLF